MLIGRALKLVAQTTYELNSLAFSERPAHLQFSGRSSRNHLNILFVVQEVSLVLGWLTETAV
jgi:hypothetical protein